MSSGGDSTTPVISSLTPTTPRDFDCAGDADLPSSARPGGTRRCAMRLCIRTGTLRAPAWRIAATLVVSIALVLNVGVRQARAAVPSTADLTTGWTLRTANNVTDTGPTISQP